MEDKCAICEEEIAEFKCSKCLRSVCKNHLDFTRKICYVCVDALCNLCSENISEGICIKCNNLVCRECSIDLDGVRLICKKCIKTTLTTKVKS